MNKTITLSENEIIAIMVGMAEFNAMTTDKKKKKVFGCYEEISNKLTEKFRQLAWDFHYEKRTL